MKQVYGLYSYEDVKQNYKRSGEADRLKIRVLVLISCSSPTLILRSLLTEMRNQVQTGQKKEPCCKNRALWGFEALLQGTT